MSNRLAGCASPYLRQHADNPVDWWPWCPEAFAEARRRDAPMLVSIGYSTCHWCHVMAHESFEDPAVAAAMNDRLVCVKVDREEHPEVDGIYMDALQALGGRGGWPLNAFCDHDGRPFHALTYLPRGDWARLVAQVAATWDAGRGRVEATCAGLHEHLLGADASSAAPLGPGAWDELDRQLALGFDREHPGLAWGPRREPKFPPGPLLALLVGDPAPERAALAEAVLAAMQDGGIHDRVGGGFHRYSVDRAWRVPHFEKMLYDNAQLMACYARAHLRLGRPDFLATAVNAADYLLRDLRVQEGGRFLGYAAAEDADDPRGEGAFYAWSPAQLAAALGAGRGARLAQEWDLAEEEAPAGADAHAGPPARHIPHPRGAGLDLAPLRAGWEELLPALRLARAARPRPGRDDKVLTDQNGLALEGLAWVARASGAERFVAAVRELAAALAARETAEGLLRLPGRPALVTDYGALACGLLAAFDLLGDPALVARAGRLLEEAAARLGAGDGGFHVAPAGRADLLRRGREHLDNAWPSGQGQLAQAAARLHHLTGLERWRDLAAGAVRAAGGQAAQAPANAGSVLQAVRLLERGTVAVASGDALLAEARRSWRAELSVVPLAGCRDEAWAVLEGRRDLAGEQALVCGGGSCRPPARTAAELRAALG